MVPSFGRSMIASSLERFRRVRVEGLGKRIEQGDQARKEKSKESSELTAKEAK
jgi:hypothetical protein